MRNIYYSDICYITERKFIDPHEGNNVMRIIYRYEFHILLSLNTSYNNNRFLCY